MASLMAREAVEGRLRLKWTQAALEDAIERGSLDPERHYEILCGELYEKLGRGWPHPFAITALALAFKNLDQERFCLMSQSSLRVGENLPEPDFIVLGGGLRGRRETPTAKDVLLLVEVSDTTFGLDSRVKAPMYAAAEIPVYWIVDIKRCRIEVHTRPESGQYAETRIFDSGQVLPPAFEGAPMVLVSDLFVVDEGPPAA